MFLFSIQYFNALLLPGLEESDDQSFCSVKRTSRINKSVFLNLIQNKAYLFMIKFKLSVLFFF